MDDSNSAASEGFGNSLLWLLSGEVISEFRPSYCDICRLIEILIEIREAPLGHESKR